MSDSSGVIKIALIGGAAYLAYRYMTEAPAAAPATTTPTPGGATAPVTTPATTTPTYNSLDAIGARILAAAGTSPDTADQFNVYLSAQLPAGKSAPDPAAVFTQEGWDRSTPLTFAQWWGVMAPYLKTNLGLSGMGVLHGLGLYIASKQAAY